MKKKEKVTNNVNQSAKQNAKPSAKQGAKQNVKPSAKQGAKQNAKPGAKQGAKQNVRPNAKQNVNKNVKKKKGKGGFIALLVILVVILAGAAVLWFFVSKKCSEAFLEGTTVNDMNVGGMSAEEVKALVKEKTEAYTLTVNFRDGTTEVLGKDELGLEYVDDKSVDALMASQNIITWIKQLTGETFTYYANEIFEIDEETVRGSISAIAERSKEDAPKNAYMTIEGERFVIIPEEEGNFLKVENVSDLVMSSAREKLDEITLTDYDDMYGSPEIRSDNEELNNSVNACNAIIDTKVDYLITVDIDDAAVNSKYITYAKGAENPILRTEALEGEDIPKSTDNGEYVVTAAGTMFLDCFVEDENGLYSLDNEAFEKKCGEFVEGMASTYSATGSSIDIVSTNLGSFGMPVDRYGFVIDAEQETQALLDNFRNTESDERVPASNFNVPKPQAPSTYIEVDKTNQHVYYYINGELYMDTACVTGLEGSAKRRTPCGFYYVYMKQRERDLKGEIDPETGEPSYVSHVSYWMPFYYGYGLHDASWRGSFGGSIYTYSGSHGCVNLPTKSAAKMYEVLEVGTPVYVLSAQ